ncbi:hypothetical protein [Companilactobacillus sp. HBUAS56257]|uniref:hypothetical protein n=1 Tax=Companilactobacillus sp. HBUAS56257 TaxID=3109360 RepID=UPI002FF0F4CF
MKFNKLITLAASLTIALTGALFVSQQDVSAAASKVTSTKNSISKLYTEKGDLITNRALAPGTNWLVDRVFYHDGETYYRVATNEFLKSSSTTKIYDKSNPNPKYIPNIRRINDYFIKYVNALHAANGTPQIAFSEDMFEYANLRAYQQVGDTLDHSTGTRNVGENLHLPGFDYYLAMGVSDKDTAWQIFQAWYDEYNNITSKNQVGHFGHRAELIYTGSPAALGMSDNAVAFNSEWTNDYSGYMSVYNYIGTNPNTKFISKDSVK